MRLTVNKRPGERLDYLLDFTQWLRDGDSIQDATVTGNEGVVIDSIEILPSGVRMWIFGGSENEQYHVDVEIVTTQDRKKKQCFTVCNRGGAADPELSALITAVSRWWVCANYTTPGDLA